jgi:hypothetical protein
MGKKDMAANFHSRSNKPSKMESRNFFFGLGALSALQVAAPLKAANPGISTPEKIRVPMKVKELQVLELLKICHIASVYGAQVIRYGNSMLAYMYVVVNQQDMVCPMVEFLIENMSGNYQYFDKNPVVPEKGLVTLSERPGFGIELDESKIESIKVVL